MISNVKYCDLSGGTAERCLVSERENEGKCSLSLLPRPDQENLQSRY